MMADTVPDTVCLSGWLADVCEYAINRAGKPASFLIVIVIIILHIGGIVNFFAESPCQSVKDAAQLVRGGKETVNGKHGNENQYDVTHNALPDSSLCYYHMQKPKV